MASTTSEIITEFGNNTLSDSERHFIIETIHNLKLLDLNVLVFRVQRILPSGLLAEFSPTISSNYCLFTSSLAGNDYTWRFDKTSWVQLHKDCQVFKRTREVSE